MAASLWRAVMGAGASSADTDTTGGVEFWRSPERAGWLTKQGEYIKTWRRRWFVLKQGRLFWFKDSGPHRQGRRGHAQPAVRLRALHPGGDHVLHRRLREGEGGVDQLHRPLHRPALPLRHRRRGRRLRQRPSCRLSHRRRRQVIDFID
uniref:Pleckstrin homology (PH) domain-containing protein-like n=1 Tax=Oryza sativa subsp. japonica TaxID=39947 RepID=Q5N891_ORYSJ|nr:pleckstrin homology (PH) domain-containing protein-like [Oryza sativa Japonica Group]BAD82313.1 pleckstrin homology (PH) domain-containing protein-like [Oryza sativa Japonica Group]